ncbi:MAG: hypothetical protein WC450_08655 [Candidatus Omnitrophota bacterium]|jgi:hypothetical protein
MEKKKRKYGIVKNGEFVTPINNKRYLHMRNAEMIATKMNKKEGKGYLYLAAFINND